MGGGNREIDMKKFALFGTAGFVAPRHLKAIKEVGGSLVASYDPFDSVGILDSFFPNSLFSTNIEEFSEFLRAGVDYFSICSPNYLHSEHAKFGLNYGADVICEKPLVLNVEMLERLKEEEKKSGHRVYSILQLRLHPAIIALRERVRSMPLDKRFDVDLTYIASRGPWYYASWKGDVAKSGGLATNIGIHFFDMLLWIFGPLKESVVEVSERDRVSGVLHLERADVRYFLSINEKFLPEVAIKGGKRTFRLLKMGGEEIEFSDGFTDLHTESYRQILAGKGFTLDDARPSIKLLENLEFRI
jgi:UDP-N-acetyl-2-amino-2-deoxyglucuronate dehydrogenase